MKGMPINALIDMLQIAMPYLEILGDRAPLIEIRNPVELIALLQLAKLEILDSGMQAIMDDHISLFRDVMYMEDEP